MKVRRPRRSRRERSPNDGQKALRVAEAGAVVDVFTLGPAPTISLFTHTPVHAASSRSGSSRRRAASRSRTWAGEEAAMPRRRRLPADTGRRVALDDHGAAHARAGCVELARLALMSTAEQGMRSAATHPTWPRRRRTKMRKLRRLIRRTVAAAWKIRAATAIPAVRSTCWDTADRPVARPISSGIGEQGR